MAFGFRKTPQPPIVPHERPSEARHPLIGTIMALAAAAAIVVGVIVSKHVVSQKKLNLILPERELVLAVTAQGSDPNNQIRRPIPGKKASVPTKMPSDNGGQADCPT